MANEFQLAIVAPDRSVMDEPVDSVIVPGIEGYFGVFAGHVPMIAALKAGLVSYKDSKGLEYRIAISGGFAEVTPERVTVLADAAERDRDIDVARAERALDEARKALKGEGSGSREEATREIERAMNRIRAAKPH